jgi:hypothetical protein
MIVIILYYKVRVIIMPLHINIVAYAFIFVGLYFNNVAGE